MPIGINKILSAGGGGSSASRVTVYDEGNDCRDFLANWNYNETSNMSVSPVPNDTMVVVDTGMDGVVRDVHIL